MMKYCRVTCLVLLAAVTLLVDAASGQTALFGPERFVRDKGSPRAITRNFSAPAPTGSFTLVVDNGKDADAVSSAVITLNGVTVVGPDTFNSQVQQVTRPIALRPTNTLTVELQSAPGSSLTITVFGETQSVAGALAGLEAAGLIPKLDRSDSLLGPDVNSNGVRDDIDLYIDNLPDSTQQKEALRQAAKAMEKAIQVGASNAAPSELKEVDIAILRSIDCIWNRYDETIAENKSAVIEKLMVNTRTRFDAYDLYNSKRSGTSMRMPRGGTCDTP
jgi:hypothetical protein